MERKQAFTRFGKTRWIALALVAALSGLFVPSHAAAEGAERSQLFTVPAEGETPEPVIGGFTLLQRKTDGAEAEARSRVEPGHAVTLWWVAFNAPEFCSPPGCGDDDVFIDPSDHSAGFNVGQIQATELSVFGSGGAVSNPAGRLKISSAFMEGELPGEGALVIGHPDDVPVFPVGVVSGLVDAQEAEIHFVLQDHGRAHEDENLLEQQLTRFMGACNIDNPDTEVGGKVCIDIQFSVHTP